MIAKRVSEISYNEDEFEKAIPLYNEALKNSGYASSFTFQQEQPKRKSRARKRNVVWFDPLTATASKPTLARSFLGFCLNTFQATTSFAKFVIKTASSLATAACPTLQPSSPLTTKRFSGKKQHNQIRSPATAETNQTVP